MLKVDFEIVGPCRRKLVFEIPNEELQKEISAIYQSISRTAKVPGFRSGKVPQEILKKRYSEEAKGELLRKVIPQAYSKAIQDNKLHPVGHPKVEVTEFKENEFLRFQALLDVQPEVKLKKYSGIPLSRKKVEVPQKEVDQALKNLREQNAQFKAIQDRGIQMGDFAILDWEMHCEGKSVETIKDRWVPVDEKYYLEKFCEPLIGANLGDKRDIEATLPKDYPQEALRGKLATFKVEVKEIKEKRLPELNDDFAKDLGKFDTLDHLKEELKKQLETFKEKEEEKGLKAQLIQSLLKENQMDLPEFLVENVTQDILDRAIQQMQTQKVPQSEIDKQKEDLSKKARERAEAEVSLAYFVDHIAKAESIKVGKEDIDKYFTQLVQAGQNPAYLEQYFRQPESIEKLKSQLLEEKVLQFLISQGKIKVE